jgi:crossover junction endodeoxyribonuclease RuvC
MALTGYGRAEKGQVQEMVKIVLNLKSSHPRMTLDRSDALALSICHINSNKYNI